MDQGISEYSLNWNGHIEHVKKAFNRLLQSNDLCDVILYAEGQKIGAHKVFLAACSKYFDQLFKDFKNERPVVVLKGVPFDILKHILNFVYNGETNIEIDRMTQFLEAAAFLKIDGLTENHMKRKRKHFVVTDSENTNIGFEHTDTPKTIQEIQEKGPSGKLSREPFCGFNPADIVSKPSKLYKSQTSANRDQEVFPDFSKASETGKYHMDSTTKVGEWFSDYELNSQSSTVESQSPREDPPLGKNIGDPAIEQNLDRGGNFEIIDIKSEIISRPLESDVEEVSSFDQNDFANSLDAEIEISDGENVESLEKQLLKTPLASRNEKGLYQCKICDNTYVKKDSLKKHFAVHVDNTTCTICGKVLSRKTHLIRHLSIHGISPK